MSILTPNFAKINDRIEFSKFILVWRVCLVCFILYIPLISSFIILDEELLFLYVLALTLAALGLLYLRITQDYKTPSLIIGIVCSLSVNYSLFTSNNALIFDDFLWLILSIILLIFLHGFKIGFTALSLNILSITYFIFFKLETKNFNVSLLDGFSHKMAYSFEMSTCLFLISYVVYESIRVRDLAEKSLVKSNADLAEKNELITISNKEKTILIKEIHHRVKNNLQTIISILRLQSGETNNKELGTQFKEAINRIHTMSSIHEKLYKQNDISNINLKNYITELSNDLKLAYDITSKVKTTIICDLIQINLKTLVPLGLLINELVSNSYKHAFGDNGGEIKITLRKLNDELILEYIDNGTWKEDSESGFGLELIELLVEQLRGTKELIKNKSKTTYSFRLKLL